MSAAAGSLIPPAGSAQLETALQSRLARSRRNNGSHGELESLALRLGLIQNTMAPQLASGSIVVFAADHGLVVDGIQTGGAPPTAQILSALAAGHLPLSAFAEMQGLELTVVDSGVAQAVAPHARLLARKIAHGTRNCRLGAAMSIENAHAAIRAGMEIGATVGGAAIACAGLGNGSVQSAALLLSCMSGVFVGEFTGAASAEDSELAARQTRVLELARERHGHLEDPVEVLAAVGGYEIAMMTGLMLEAASRRRVIISDGLAASAALAVAAAIAPSTPSYCFHARSNRSAGVERALGLFGAKAVIDLGFDSLDGTGATFAWPLLRCATALCADFGVELDAAPSPPGRRGA